MCSYNNTIDTNQITFLTSDFIPVLNNAGDKNKRNKTSNTYLYYHYPMIKADNYYSIIKVFDINKEEIWNFKLGNAVNGFIPIFLDENAYYVRVSISIDGESYKSGLYETKADYRSGNIDLLKLNSKVNYNCFSIEGSPDSTRKVEVKEYILNKRIQQGDGKVINNQGFVMAIIDASKINGKTLYCKTYPVQYSPGIYMFDHFDKDSDHNSIFCVGAYDQLDFTTIERNDGVYIPSGVTTIVIQGCFSISSAIQEEFNYSDYLYASLFREVNTLEKTIVSSLAEQKTVGSHNDKINYRFNNFLDTDNLVGEYILHKRTDQNGIISAPNFSMLIIKLSEIENGFKYKHLNVHCTSSQYVPGIKFFRNEDENSIGYETNNLISEILISDTQTQDLTIYKVQVDIPIGTKMIIVQCRMDGYDSYNYTLSDVKKVLSASLTSAPFVSKTELDDKINLIASDQRNYWKDKNIWWCGTSIPAAGYWNVDNTNSYPLMVGELLKAKKVFNEAVGSSCASGSNNGGSYEVVSRRMGDTIERKLSIFNDCWTIDDISKTVKNGPRSLGISSIPSVSDYNTACTYRMQILSNCYEIKLIAKYLLKDQTEHDKFLKEKFGIH